MKDADIDLDDIDEDEGKKKKVKKVKPSSNKETIELLNDLDIDPD